ncbi:MAG: hypothetical protein AAFR57_06690 [Pseudomonadota bacterium]
MARTALDQYDRLEALGLWQEGDDTSPREVIVSFGEATLTLRDGAEAPLAHWSLAALEVLAEDKERLVLSPDPDGAETLTITDRDMIGAIATVRTAARPRTRGRKRRIGAWMLLVLLIPIAAGLIWPRTLAGALAPLVPDPLWLPLPAQVMEVEFNRPSLFLCRDGRSAGLPPPALRRMIRQVDPDGVLSVRFGRFDGPPLLNAGGPDTLVNARALRDMVQPEELSGLLALAAARAVTPEYRARLGEAIGLRGLLTLGFQRNLGPEELEAARTLTRAYSAESSAVDEETLRRLEAAGLPSLPLVLPLSSAGAPEHRLERIVAGDSVRGAEFLPALGDNDWLRLQSACQE